MPAPARRVIVIDADEKKRRHLNGLLDERGCPAAACGDVESGLAELAARPCQSVFCDVQLVGELLERLDELEPPPIVIVTAADLATGVRAVERGAFDCLVTPVAPLELALALSRVSALDSARRGEHAAARPARRPGSGHLPMMGGMVGASQPMRAVFQIIEKIAPHKTSILIGGESGTGKELVARAIHELSPRRRRRFVAINCGAIPANLLESELFGYRRGAFTDAVRDKSGLFEVADGGTLFLDEIGELPLGLQVKLLRAIQEEEIRRIGDNATIKVDVRIVAATLRDLTRDVAAGRFREDLFYRLNVVPVPLPPLRDRRDDIPLLVEHFVAKYARKHSKDIQGVSEDAMALLEGYAWPGNIRELENTIERAMILCDGPIIGANLLEDKLSRRPEPVPSVPVEDVETLSIKQATRQIEEKLIRKALQATSGNRTSAAKLLEISHRALLYKIREYKI